MEDKEKQNKNTKDKKSNTTEMGDPESEITKNGENNKNNIEKNKKNGSSSNTGSESELKNGNNRKNESNSTKTSNSQHSSDKYESRDKKASKNQTGDSKNNARNRVQNSSGKSQQGEAAKQSTSPASPASEDSNQNPKSISEQVKEDIENQEIPIVNPDDIDPIKNGIINASDVKIKVDDLSKRNYQSIRDNILKEKVESIIDRLKQSNLYKDVFYTNTYDIGVEIELQPNNNAISNFNSTYRKLQSLIQVTINQFKVLFKSGSKTTNKLKFGRLDSRTMVRGIINEDPHIFKKKIFDKGTDEIAIALLIDQSGSMKGPKIKNAKKAAILFGEVLNSLNLNFAIYGWTDINYFDSYIKSKIKRSSKPLPLAPSINFPRDINPEIFTLLCYKEFGENYDKCKEKLGLIEEMYDNSDHNAIEKITKILHETKKRIKILMVLSDGQPAAYSYKYIKNRLIKMGDKKASAGNIGINVTRQAIEKAQKLGVQTLCISIDSRSNYQEQIYGKNNFIIIDPRNINELPVKVARILSLILRRSGVKL
ncbi:MAG: hypothetical protein GF329_17415 [Candidatus Lokiarchaeota archaeon]|nr:hypothetical protein [Candidatus Lokiarchaeota archaeon]